MMKHYIIVKFVDGTDVKALEEPVCRIFEETLEIPGIHALKVKMSNSDRSNRYDLMIELDMDSFPRMTLLSRITDGRKSTATGSRRRRSLIATFDCDN